MLKIKGYIDLLILQEYKSSINYIKIEEVNNE